MTLKSHWYVFTLWIFLISCAPKAPFVWVESLPQKEQKTKPYRIALGDQIEVSVWDQAQISGTYTVRQDGFISVPLVGELKVVGTTPSGTAEVIRSKLEGDIVQDVRVVVISRQTTPLFVSVLGEVRTPGQIVLKPRDSIVDVIAMAGGISEFADKKSIYIFRHASPYPRIRFHYDRLTSCPTGGIQFKLQDGDVIIVE